MAKQNTNLFLLDRIKNNQLKSDMPMVHVGDSITIARRIVEEKKTRIQKYTGVVLRIKGKSNSKTLLVRKDSYGVGVEYTIPLHSPLNVSIEIIKRGKVRRAYISYMRNRSGKSAKIKEQTKTTTKK